MKHIKLFEEFVNLNEKTMDSHLLYKYKDEIRNIEGDILNKLDSLDVDEEDVDSLLGLLINQMSKSVPSVKCR
tara:strand:- start:4096 stop:4314 length:219 start_codon:yes stop_codon:yes gene_type:complete